jgi:hypothetical protein
VSSDRAQEVRELLSGCDCKAEAFELMSELIDLLEARIYELRDELELAGCER